MRSKGKRAMETPKGRRTRETGSKKKKGLSFFSKLIIVALFLVCVGTVINLAPNFIRSKVSNKTNIIINNNNVTSSLKHDIKVDEDDNIFISFEDIKNFFDENIYYDKQYKQIITSSDSKLAAIEIGKKQMNVNGSKVNIYATAYEKDNTYYLPFSEMKNVYNVDIKYSKDEKIITVDSLDREQKMGNSSKDAGVKYMPTTFSKNVDTVKKGESVVVISQKDGWYKVRTNKGNIGYLKEVTNIYSVRENNEREKQIQGKVSMVWDYYNATAPTRSGKIEGINVVSPTFGSVVKTGNGELTNKIGTAGQAYITWAHSNGYKIWPLIANDELTQADTSRILNDYKNRETLIDNIVNLVLRNDLDGVNIDFENIKESDKDMYTRFIIELTPRLKEYNKVVSVNVTAPDGSSNWSMCYDRHKLAKVADYIVFMAYDQYGESSDKAGTTAGLDWIKVNLDKFVGTQEEVDRDKLILGMPFFTRLWKETGSSLSNTSVTLKNIESNIPSGVQKQWKENLQQYYIEYQSGGSTYKMWIEDEKSLKAKFDLMNEYKLAGAAYWQKDFEAQNTWSLVANEINK